MQTILMKWNQILCYKLVGCYHVFFNLDVTMLQPNIGEIQQKYYIDI